MSSLKTNPSTQSHAGQLLHLRKECKTAHSFFYRFIVAPEDDDPRRVLEYMKATFLRNYGATPSFFIGTLEDAVHAALHSDSIEDVRLVLE